MPVRTRIGIFFETMNHADYFQIGFIKKPHGLKGDVHLALAGPFDLEEIMVLFLEIDGQLIPHFIDSFSSNGEKVTLKFEDIDSVEDAKRISAKRVFLQKSARPKLPEGEYYDDELMGFAVMDDKAGLLGFLEEIISAGSNRLMVVKKESSEVLIPENGPFITEINVEKKTILVHLPDGFLEMNR